MLWKGFPAPQARRIESETLTSTLRQVYCSAVRAGFRHDDRQCAAALPVVSIEGAAITAIHIRGRAHEFSSIPGVVETSTGHHLNFEAGAPQAAG